MSVGKYAEQASAERSRADAAPPPIRLIEQVVAFSERLTDNDPAIACASTLDFLQQHGLRSLTVASYNGAGGGGRHVLFSNLPPQMLGWVPPGGLARTPIFRAVPEFRRPITTKFAFESYPDAPETELTINLFRDCGLGDGIIVPIMDGNRIVGHAAAGAYDFNFGIHECQVVAMAIEAMLARLMQSDHHAELVNRRLTPRQCDVLSWAANGKTNSEIAQILGISTRTVVAHIQQAAEALGTVNKTQTVARALVYGEITP